MRVRNLHGYFLFDETNVGQISDFMSYTGLTLVKRGDHYTFDFLADAPEYSLKGKDFLGFTALKTFAGKPWEVFEANGCVYDFNAGIMKPILSVVDNVVIKLSGNRYTANGLILPGSLTDSGDRVKDYAAWFSQGRLTWLYSEVTYV